MNQAKSDRTAHLRNTIRTMIALATASLGFVAALAWNDAIKALIQKILGPDESLGGLFIYAVTATVIAIVTLMLLGRVATRVGGEVAIEREVD